MNPMIPGAPGPNFSPRMKFREESGRQVTSFIGWMLQPISGQPGQKIEMNVKVPASSREIPNAWKGNSMFPDKNPGAPIPDGSGGHGVLIPGTRVYASDGSAMPSGGGVRM